MGEHGSDPGQCSERRGSLESVHSGRNGAQIVGPCASQMTTAAEFAFGSVVPGVRTVVNEIDSNHCVYPSSLGGNLSCVRITWLLCLGVAKAENQSDTMKATERQRLGPEENREIIFVIQCPNRNVFSR